MFYLQGEWVKALLTHLLLKYFHWIVIIIASIILLLLLYLLCRSTIVQQHGRMAKNTEII